MQRGVAKQRFGRHVYLPKIARHPSQNTLKYVFAEISCWLKVLRRAALSLTQAILGPFWRLTQPYAPGVYLTQALRKELFRYLR